MKQLALTIFITSLWVVALTGCDSNLKDRDGNSYRTVKIGNQTWMAENLKVRTEGSWCYRNMESYCQKYGRLYNWDAAKAACPAGWHLPTKGEFGALIEAVGRKDKSGKKASDKKLKSTSGWEFEEENYNGDDAYGFSALPAGRRDGSERYLNGGGDAYFWSSTEYSRFSAFYMSLTCGVSGVGFDDDENKDFGFSVRCLKD